jgi:hypothetical protein
MSARPGRETARLALSAALIAMLCALAAPSSALAHGLSGRQDVPLPTWLFLWGAALVLIVSFVALATLWPRPRLQEDSWRPLPSGFSRAVTSTPVAVLCGAVGFLLLGLVLYAGFEGTSNTGDNLAPTFVYITFWLGLLPLSLLFGDVFRAFNPWRAPARAVAWLASKAAEEPVPAPLAYPERLGRWPAVVGVLAFGWLELAANGGDQPQTIATAALIYSVITWLGMALYGIDGWANRGETFSVYFNLVARMSVFERRGDEIGVRRPLSGLPRWEPAPGSVVFVCALIGVVTFDGFSAGPTWNDWIPAVQDRLVSLGFDRVNALEVMFGCGMLLTVALTCGFYMLGIWGARHVGGGFTARQLATTFAHTLAPIALVYALAHYFSFFMFQGQDVIRLASDPLGDGSDVFGTATRTIDFTLVSTKFIWYFQVAAVIAGHVAALMLAHDRAIAIYEDAKQATRSQYWMLAVMVGFTTLALWLLSESSKL